MDIFPSIYRPISPAKTKRTKRENPHKYEIPLYTSCCNTDKGIYYYNTYDNHRITGVDMHRENLDGDALIVYEPILGEQIKMQN